MKKVIRGTMTDRGQVTVPTEVRKLLGLGKGPVNFIIEDGVVVLERPALSWRDVGGSIKPLRTPEDWDARIREAKEEKAAETIRKMRQN